MFLNTPCRGYLRLMSTSMLPAIDNVDLFTGDVMKMVFFAHETIQRQIMLDSNIFQITFAYCGKKLQNNVGIQKKVFITKHDKFKEMKKTKYLLIQN